MKQIFKHSSKVNTQTRLEQLQRQMVRKTQNHKISSYLKFSFKFYVTMVII